MSIFKVMDRYECGDCGGETNRTRLAADEDDAEEWGGQVICRHCGSSNTQVTLKGLPWHDESGLSDAAKKVKAPVVTSAGARLRELTIGGFKTGDVAVIASGSGGRSTYAEVIDALGRKA